MIEFRQYKNNAGNTVTIEGRVKEFSETEKPYVWSLQGNWYHYQTGQFVGCRKVSHDPFVLEHYLLATDHRLSLKTN